MVRSYVSHLESVADGTRFDFGKVWPMHEGQPLRVAYDLVKARRSLRREDFAREAPDLWRYRSLLPVGEQVISLGEIMTPLLFAPRLAAEIGVKRLLIKDESRMPTGSFKARGMAVAITMACGLRQRHVALASAGNAGAAAAAYAARAGLGCHVFMPVDAPEINRSETALFGAKVWLVEGSLVDCGALAREACERFGWYDLSTLREPYRLEGKKTMGFEIAEQLDWKLPGAIFYPTGGGMGLLGMWKAFQELEQLGWLERAPVPRMFACQADGCAPLKAAFNAGDASARSLTTGQTVASGLRVPRVAGDTLVLATVRASRGHVLSATDEEMLLWLRRAVALEGISLCPEAAVALACLEQAVRTGLVATGETIVLFNTGAVQKYAEVIRRDLPRLRPDAVDWSRIGSAM